MFEDDDNKDEFGIEPDESPSASESSTSLLPSDAVLIPTSQLRRFMELREDRDEKKKAAETAEKAYREAEADLFDLIDSSPVDRLSNVDLGPPWGKVSFGKRETHFGRVIKGMEREAIAYYTAKGDLEAMTEPKLVKKRLNEDVRAHLEEGTPLPPGIDFYTNRGMTVTREKKDQ